MAAAVSVIALASGCGSDGADTKTLDVATSPRIEVVATEMAFTPDELAVRAGTVEVILTNEGLVYHDLRIGEEPFIVEAASGATDRSTVTLDAGTYELYCSIAGHREAGMVGVLEVRDS